MIELNNDGLVHARCASPTKPLDRKCSHKASDWCIGTMTPPCSTQRRGQLRPS